MDPDYIHSPGRWRRFFRLLFVGAFAAAFVAFLYYKRSLLYRLMELTALDFALILICTLAMTFFLGAELWTKMKIFRVRLRFAEWFGLTVFALVTNYYIPAKGGIVLRAYYLKHVHGMHYPEFAALSVGANVVQIVWTSFLGLSITFIYMWMGWDGNPVFVYTFAAATGMAVLGIGLLLLFSRISIPRIGRYVEKFYSGLKAFGQKKKILPAIMSWRLGFFVVRSMQLYFCFRAVHVSIPFVNIFLVILVLSLSQIVAVTPANLGVAEGLIVLLTTASGAGFDESVLAAGLSRAMRILVNGTAFPLFSRMLMRNLR